jgi:hypothetical protein
MTDLVVGSVDKNFVNNLVETWHVFDVTVYHALILRVIRPDRLCDGLNAPNIGIRTLQDVLDLGQLVETHYETLKMG